MGRDSFGIGRDQRPEALDARVALQTGGREVVQLAGDQRVPGRHQIAVATRGCKLGEFDRDTYRTPSLSPDRCSLYIEADNGIYSFTRR